MTAASNASPARRVASIDAARGVVMIIMALDHVRDFIHRGAMVFNPTDLTQTTPILFFTRWITHICAPSFMFTAGLGAFLWLQRGKTRRELSKFLWTRGLWLILLELTVMRLAYNFDFSLKYPFLLLVLWVLGACMIGLAALIWIPIRALTVLCVFVILLHNTLDRISPAMFGSAGGIWNVIHQPGVFAIGGLIFILGYPLIPWVFVMALGFCAGQLYLMESEQRRRYLLILGAAATIGFFVVRGLNIYGDPIPWSHQSTPTFTVLSFLDTTKYPPSLAFLLMTLGPALLLLAWFERVQWTDGNPLIVFGRVPLFYFVVHFYLAHAAAVVLALVRYGSSAWHFIWSPVPSMGAPKGLYPPDFGYDLWVAYLVWAVIVVGLYPVCRWFGGVKAGRGKWWLSYL
ncbi:MAG TPA: heparan-alpha-glucosaminide N-acetyltransferase domain-containing protein [Gemmatimonadales bacterium]|nr:heparan-alpha-glucosaminide N-acetyltransferase domain-containing protein [Gemmatimonadales bacterium]